MSNQDTSLKLEPTQVLLEFNTEKQGLDYCPGLDTDVDFDYWNATWNYLPQRPKKVASDAD